MVVTVVIPTYNRKHLLLNTLLSLNHQTYKNFSVIVIDDGSEDDTTGLIQMNVEKFNYKIKLIRQKNAGASVALNRGIQKAEEGLIILLDDDILPSNDLIKKHLQHHSIYPGSVVSGTACSPPKSKMSDVEKYKLFMEEEWKKKLPQTPFFNVNKENFIVTTANTSFHTETFRKIGEFNTTLQDGYDVEFHIRALKKNISVYFDTRIHSFHHDHFTLHHYAKRQKAYILSKKKISVLHPDYSDLLLSHTHSRNILHRWVYKIIRTACISRWIENSEFLLILPKKIRYKLYGITIAALSE